MIRFDWKSPAPIAALLLVVGSGTLTAGVWDFWKAPAKKPTQESRGIVARGQEPSPAPPAPLNAAPDPGYNPPAEPAPSQPTAPTAPPAQVWMAPNTTDCAPQFSGFSGGGAGSVCMGHACPARRESNSWGGWKLAKSSARMHGDSFYEDCYPLFGPRYGYYDTCWRRLPEDCRCPIFVPPRKSQTTPVPEESAPTGEVIPPPPQVLNFR